MTTKKKFIPKRIQRWISNGYRKIPQTNHPLNNKLKPIKFSHFLKIDYICRDKPNNRLLPVWDFSCKCGAKIKMKLAYWKYGKRKNCGCEKVVYVPPPPGSAKRMQSIKATQLRHKQMHIDTVTFYLGNVHRKERPLKVTVYEANMVWYGQMTVEEIIQKRKNQPIKKVA